MNGDTVQKIKTHSATGGIALSAGLAAGLMLTGTYKGKVDAHEIGLKEIIVRTTAIERLAAVSEQRLTTSEARLEKLETFIFDRVNIK